MSDLTDLLTLPLAELIGVDDTALDEAIRKVTEDAEQLPGRSVSAFNSAI